MSTVYPMFILGVFIGAMLVTAPVVRRADKAFEDYLTALRKSGSLGVPSKEHSAYVAASRKANRLTLLAMTMAVIVSLITYFAAI